MENIRPDILTFTGVYFNFLCPHPSMVRMVDIARGLSHACRFAGQCRTFYSVAQHSVLASLIVPREDAFAALMHDAAEAYLGDMTRPLKRLIPAFREIEDRVQAVIAHRFGLPETMPDSVKHADVVMLATEQRDFMAAHDDHWGVITGIAPLRENIEPWRADRAYAEFLARFTDIVPAGVEWA